MNLPDFATIRNGIQPAQSVLIINPINAGGGDRSTGLKVKTCFEAMGFLTKLLPVKLPAEIENILELCDRVIAQTEPLILDDQTRAIIKSKPLVVITPLNKLFCTPVKSVFDTINRHIRLEKDKLLIINEMAYQAGEKSLSLFSHFLKSLNFRHVQEYTLGFDKLQAQIGYMKLPDSEVADIKQNHQAGIKKFLDGLKIDINIENNLVFFSYLSSGTPLMCALNFIQNSMIEVQAVDENHQKKGLHYVFVVREDPDGTLADWLNHHLAISKGSPFFINGTSVCIFRFANNQLKPELETFKKDRPTGRRINIYLVDQHIPMPLFRYFIALSTLGAMTGDNSFWEYLSIKKSLPYYEIQHWKSEFVKGWWQMADASGIPHLKGFYQARCFGDYRPVDEFYSPHHCLGMTQITQDSPDGKKEMTEQETVALIKEITRRKHEFEAGMLAQDARLSIQELCQSFSPRRSLRIRACLDS